MITTKTKFQRSNKIFDMIKRYRRNKNKVGSIKNKDSKIVYNDSKKRKTFENNFKSLQAMPVKDQTKQTHSFK